MKLFSYITDKSEMKIGIEIDRQKYNFSQIWEFYKDIKGKHHVPQLVFLQMMVELNLFSYQDIQGVISTVKEFRALNDVMIDGHIRYDVPIGRPQKILCIGRNYREHAKESGYAAPKEPIFFAKMPTAMLAHEGEIVLPANVGRVDHEIELGLVIGRQCRHVSESHALECVTGYTIVNDITARELQKSDIEKHHPWLRSKSFDTFFPIGPFLVPAAIIPDPQNLSLTLKVNDEIKQRANMSEMIFSIPELISYISRFMTLCPGDIIATGTPQGISALTAGDVVTAEIGELGILRNRVV